MFLVVKRKDISLVRIVHVLLLASRTTNLRQQFREHIDARADAHYPPAVHNVQGGAIPASSREQIAANDGQSKESAWDGKESVGQDLALWAADALSQLRLSIVIAEGTTDSAVREEVAVEKALNKVTLGRPRTAQKVVIKM